MTTRTSQDRNRPSSRLDSEGEEEEDDADKVNVECSSRFKIQIVHKVDSLSKLILDDNLMLEKVYLLST